MNPRPARFNRPSRQPLTRSKLLLCVLVAIFSITCATPLVVGGNPPGCESPTPEGVESFASILSDERIDPQDRHNLEVLVATYVRSCEAIDAYRRAE